MLKKQQPVTVPPANSFGRGDNFLAIENLSCGEADENLLKCPGGVISTPMAEVACFFEPKHVGVVCGDPPSEYFHSVEKVGYNLVMP